MDNLLGRLRDLLGNGYGAILRLLMYLGVITTGLESDLEGVVEAIAAVLEFLGQVWPLAVALVMDVVNALVTAWNNLRGPKLPDA